MTAYLVVAAVVTVVMMPAPLTRFVVGYAAGRRSRLAKACTYVITAAVVGLLSFTALRASIVGLSWLSASKPENYVKSLTCTADSTGDLTAMAVITNSTGTALIFGADEALGLALTSGDAPYERHGTSARIVRSSSGASLPIYIIQPKETAWIELRGLSTEDVRKFLRVFSPYRMNTCSFEFGENRLAEVGAPEVKGKFVLQVRGGTSDVHSSGMSRR
jgi:hypothetical protein